MNPGSRAWCPMPVLFFLLLLLFGNSVCGQNCSKQNPCATGCCSKDGWCGTSEDHCSAGNCVDTCDYKLGCDADNPCETGCCSTAGYCGLGPDYCAEGNCVSGCDSKAQCDPGYGAQWAEKARCPLNVCCSEFGFCGTTEEFCGLKKVKRPTCDTDKTTLDRVVGYYESWASQRPCHEFWPEQIPMGVYTHINFAFAAIDPETFEVRPGQRRDIELLMRVAHLKKLDPDLKVMIALGGWSFNDPGPTETTFSDIARSREKQQRFFKSLLSFLSTYNLDGVDLDWEYPGADDRSGRPEDFANFPTFIASLKSALDGSGGRNELSITLPASFWYLQHFDIQKLARHVDFFNIMSYDLHGVWDLPNRWMGPYLNAHTNLTEIDQALELLWRNNIDSSKVVLGMAFYARAYTVVDPSCVEPGCLFSSGSDIGQCSREVGVLLNNEIDDIVADRDLTPTLYKEAAVKVVHWDNQWLTYDDADTFKLKVDYARSSCLGGVMVWAVSHDTPDAKYSRALGKVSSRTKITMPGIFVALPAGGGDGENDPYEPKMEDHLQCRWANCGDFCPAGWHMMTRDDEWRREDGEIMMDDTACTSPHGRRLCCPPNEVKPSCGWYSFNGGQCDGTCPPGRVEVGSLRNGCRSGWQSACCTSGDDNTERRLATALYNTCRWAYAPTCLRGECSVQFPGSPYTSEFVESRDGSGGAYCDANWMWEPYDKRKYCCDTNNPLQAWGACEWRDNLEGQGTVGKKCMPNCKTNEIKVAMDGKGKCDGPGGGASSYCCTGVYQTESGTQLIPALAGYERSIKDWVEEADCPNVDVADLYARSELVERDEQLSPKQYRFIAVAQLLGLMIELYGSGKITSMLQAVKNIVDEYLPGKWPNLTADNIGAWTTNTTVNPDARKYSGPRWADEILCHPDDYNLVVAPGYRNPSHVCLNPCAYGDSQKRSIGANRTLVSRNIENSGADRDATHEPNRQPTWGFMMEEIMADHMTLAYEQLIWIQGHDEPALEIVWELPGGERYAGLTEEELDEPTPDDERYREFRRDRWVVFHFHFEHLRNFDGVMLPGIHAINVFHARDWYNNNARFSRIDADPLSEGTARAPILTCGREWNLNSFWYPGGPTRFEEFDIPWWAARVNRFGDYLWTNGLITADTFTGPTQGNLQLTPEPDTESYDCPVSMFDWNSMPRQSRQFGPDGPTSGRWQPDT